MDLGETLKKAIGTSTRDFLRSPQYSTRLHTLRTSLKASMRGFLIEDVSDWSFNFLWDSLGASLWDSLENIQTGWLKENDNGEDNS